MACRPRTTTRPYGFLRVDSQINEGCNLCNETLREASSTNRLVHIPEAPSSCYMLRDNVLVDVSCPKCQSRGRIRVLANILATAAPFLSKTKPALLVSSSKPERRVISRYLPIGKHISFQGDHSDPNCIVGVDITKMPEIDSETFGSAFACVVLDYVPEVGDAFDEISRVLINGGSSFLYSALAHYP